MASGPYAPAAIDGCWDAIHAANPDAQLSGIYANKYGYHNCRNQLPPDDYSVIKPYDKEGDGWAASGIDITLNDADIAAYTQRLIDATLAGAGEGNGPLRGVREFFGTTNGTTVTGMDVPGKYWVTSDDSHLWHNHVSGKRSHSNDEAAWADVAAVMLGKEGTDMPSQLYLKATPAKPTRIAEAGVWYTVGWDDYADGVSGGSSCVLPPAARLFDQTVDLYVDGLDPDSNLYVRIQTLDRDGNQRALFPVAELRASAGGQTDLSYSRNGSVGDSTNLRVLVSATMPCVVSQAWWRVFYW